MKLLKTLGATSEIWQVFIQDSSSTVGAGLTGLVFNTSSLTAYYHRDTDTTATAITLVTMTVGTFTSSGFKEIDATNMPGWYQFCPPNAALASGAKSCAFHLKGATNMAPLPIEVQLTGPNLDDAVRAGLTALPNAAAAASGGLIINGSNAGTVTLAALTITGATTLTGNVVLSDGLTISSPSTGNRAGLSIAGNGTGAGLLVTGGTTGHALSLVGGGTSGNGINAVTTSGHGINLAPVGTNMHGLLSTGGNGGTSDGIKAVAGTGGVPIRGDLTGNITGNLSGSAGSVSGAVGSVTGNVGGNVTGSVGSVSGAVGSVTGNVGGNVIGTVASVVGNVGGNVTGSVGSVAGNVTGSVGSVTGNVGGNVTGSVGSVSARVTANVDQLGGVAQSLTDLKDFADTGYDPVTHRANASVQDISGNDPSTEITAAVENASLIVTVSAGSRTAIATTMFATVVSESYAAVNVVPTMGQLMHEILSILDRFNISGTTITMKKVDGTTDAFTSVLDAVPAPSSRTRAT